MFQALDAGFASDITMMSQNSQRNGHPRENWSEWRIAIAIEQTKRGVGEAVSATVSVRDSEARSTALRNPGRSAGRCTGSGGTTVSASVS